MRVVLQTTCKIQIGKVKASTFDLCADARSMTAPTYDTHDLVKKSAEKAKMYRIRIQSKRKLAQLIPDICSYPGLPAATASLCPRYL